MNVSLGTSWAAQASTPVAIADMNQMDMLQLQGSTEAQGSIDGKDSIKSDLDSMSEMGETESLRLGLSSHEVPHAPAAYFNPKEVTIDRPAAMEDQKDSLSELGEEQLLRVQMVMDRMNRADSAQSNLVPKVSE